MARKIRKNFNFYVDGKGYAGARFGSVIYPINVDKVAHVVTDAGLRGRQLRLHPVHTASSAGDKRAATAGYDSVNGTFSIPPRTAVVFVED